MEKERRFTLSVFTENRVGLLNRITIIFTRRHLNIESLTASVSEVKDIYRYTITLKTTRTQVQKVVAQIEKLVDVIKAFVYEEEEVVYQELALYKVSTDAFVGGTMEKIIRENHARILTVEPEFIVIEKTGYKDEIDTLFAQLAPFKVLEFACSGRVALSKPMTRLNTYLNEINQGYELKIRSQNEEVRSNFMSVEL